MRKQTHISRHRLVPVTKYFLFDIKRYPPNARACKRPDPLRLRCSHLPARQGLVLKANTSYASLTFLARPVYSQTSAPVQGCRWEDKGSKSASGLRSLRCTGYGHQPDYQAMSFGLLKCFAELRVVDQIPYLRVNAFFSMLLAKSGVSSWLCRSDAACLAAAASANVMP